MHPQQNRIRSGSQGDQLVFAAVVSWGEVLINVNTGKKWLLLRGLGIAYNLAAIICLVSKEPLGRRLLPDKTNKHCAGYTSEWTILDSVFCIPILRLNS